MPIRIRVDLGPATTGRGAPPRSGRAVSAAVLAAVRDFSSPALAQALHTPPGYKPYTVTPVLSSPAPAAREAAGSPWFGLSLLADDLAGPVLAALEAAKEIRIGRASYSAVSITVPESATYKDLADGAAAATTWQFSLITPAGFATSADEGPRREIPWPEPARAFTGLARRWAYFAPAVPLPADTETAIRSHIEVSDFDMRMARYPVKPGEAERHGAIGSITYRIAAADRLRPVTIAALDTLARYALYAGLGDRTSIGMGYAQPPGSV